MAKKNTVNVLKSEIKLLKKELSRAKKKVNRFEDLEIKQAEEFLKEEIEEREEVSTSHKCPKCTNCVKGRLHSLTIGDYKLKTKNL